MDIDKLRELDLNLLVTLQALIETGSVTDAAERLGITQSGASRALARLRAAFDDPLFVMQGNSFVATPRCESVIPELQRCLEAAADVFAATKWEPATETGTFRLAMPDHLAFIYGARIHDRMEREAPGADVVIHGFFADWRRAILDGEVDLAFGVPMGTEPALQMKATKIDPWVVLVRTGHPVLSQKWSAKTFSQGHHGLMAVPGTGPSQVDRALAKLGLERNVTFRSTSPLVVAMMAAETDLRVTTTRALAEKLTEMLPLQILELPVKAESLRLPLVWHEKYANDPRHRWLRALVADVVA